MRAFRFRLERLLRLRAHHERRARSAYARELGELSVLEQRARVVRADLALCREQAAGTGAAAGLAQALADGLEARQRRLAIEVSRAEARVEAARSEFRARRQELRSLERLRDRRHEEWRTTAMAAEQHELEEAARAQRGAPTGREGIRS